MLIVRMANSFAKLRTTCLFEQAVVSFPDRFRVTHAQKTWKARKV
jgi:hypothetical protein